MNHFAASSPKHSSDVTRDGREYLIPGPLKSGSLHIRFADRQAEAAERAGEYKIAKSGVKMGAIYRADRVCRARGLRFGPTLGGCQQHIFCSP
jgi:hypothetical protein